MAIDLNGKRILVTGGTGSFGKDFIKRIIKRFPQIQSLVIYSRDEHKQYELARQFSDAAYQCLQYIIGDVRDLSRLEQVCQGIDIIIHAAALKHVAIGESNPMEFVKTNVLGAENVVQAALRCGVQKVIALSSDKAAAPTNLYGSTKLCAEKIFAAANGLSGKQRTVFSIVRYGNVLGSRGSVVPLFLQTRKTGVLPITHPQMSRFSILPDEEVELILYALEHAWGGEVFVPQLPSYRITDLAQAIAPECKLELVGIRPGEKLHETIITESEALHTFALNRHFVICPTLPLWSREAYEQAFGAKKIEEGFCYQSSLNSNWLTIEELREQVKNTCTVLQGLDLEV